MHELNKTSFDIFLNNIQKQFLCCYPLKCMLWQDFPENLEWEQQKTLFDSTFKHPLNEQYPIKLTYQLCFLKKMISYLETSCAEVHDAVYETLCQIQQNLYKECATKYAFKHYIFKPGIQLTLRESKSFVESGTTGLCSWQASLALADFLIENPSVVEDKCVLELGAGIGFCGLTMVKMCRPRHVLLTDGNLLCIEVMREGFKRNFPEVIEVNDQFKINSQTVECCVLSWDCIGDNNNISVLKPDVIIAADVVYDNSCFSDLSRAIDYVFKLKKDKVQMLLAVTVRNEVTLNGFLDTMESMCFKISNCNIITMAKSNLFWDRSTPVKILQLTR